MSDAQTLRDVIARARGTFDALSPVDQALHRDEQRRSWARGMCGRDPGPSVLAEEVRRLRAENAALRARLAKMEASDAR